MANSSSRQPSSSSSSHARRSTRLSLRNSIVGTPGRASRQPSIRRASSRVDPNLDLNDFDWGELPEFYDEDDGLQNRADFTFNGFVEPEYAIEQPLNGVPAGHAPINYYNNPNVAVPSTPHSASFPPTNRHQQAIPVVINGQTLMLSQEQVDAMNAVVPGLAPQAMLTDGKRTSVPKSPGLRKHRQSQFRAQATYNDPFVGSEHIDPSELDFNAFPKYPTYPEPTAYHGGYADTRQTQPYYQGTQWQGVPSPGGRHLQLQPPEPEYLQPAYPQQVSAPSQYLFQDLNFDGLYANEYQTRSNQSAYTSRNYSPGHGRRNPPVEPKKSVRQDKPRASVFDRDANEQYQKPKIAAFNPEVRINKTTRGITTRTAKINQYDPRNYYTYTPHPLGTETQPHGAPWNHPNSPYTHKYRDSSLKEYDGGEEIAIYELENREMSPDEIQDFILGYPSSRNKLTLRIQVTPGDSGRRYRSGADKCRFVDCPNRVGGLPATIKHGWYRIAFDERDDDEYDPFAANCGFVHLYCMERFLDFEYICRKANVMVDFRAHMRNEPRGIFAAAFSGKQLGAGQLAEQFVLHARTKLPGNAPRQRGDHHGVRRMREFQNYPVTRPYNGQIWDPTYNFEDTLSYHMNLRMEEERAAAQMAQFAAKGLGPTVLSVHRGDLGMQAEANIREKQVKKMSRNKGRKKGKNVPNTYAFNGNSSFDIEVRRRIKRAEDVLKKRSLEPRVRRAPQDTDHELEDIDEEEGGEVAPNHFGRQPWELPDDASDVEDGHTFREGTRRSRRIEGKQPVYRDEPDIGQTYELRPERSFKRSFRGYEQSQQNTDQFTYGQAQQYLQNAYAHNGYAQGFMEEPAPKRKRSAVPPPGYARARSWQPDPFPQPQLWQPDNNEYGADLNDLFVDTNLAPSPKRKRSSRNDEQQQQLAQYRTRRLSSMVGSVPASSIMRHPGSRTPSGSKRHASFNNQPVSQQKTFRSDAPPHNVQPRMLKELEDVSTSPRGSKPDVSAGRTLRSGRSLSGLSPD
ncbi:hypothetical protein P171DRAFT_522415 [Karstenula rhodostoma CBS 690.94]|uniref:Uncharacterized protein n=1 Tax=Karstenula rhodostoma CBS 690.94 TaxID=1392251 RepID=A0A9P4PEJ5_9PLEO|nr:hypothetical protein P171DRAFT_522415 [Karstenula rhodostoma CBS 690.94]